MATAAVRHRETFLTRAPGHGPVWRRLLGLREELVRHRWRRRGHDDAAQRRRASRQAPGLVSAPPFYPARPSLYSVCLPILLHNALHVSICMCVPSLRPPNTRRQQGITSDERRRELLLHFVPHDRHHSPGNVVPRIVPPSSRNDITEVNYRVRGACYVVCMCVFRVFDRAVV